MAKNKSGSNIWIAGAVIGAVVGAAYALWKTPMSGQELRGKLSPGPVVQHDGVDTSNVRTPNMGDAILSKVEHTLAPIVGVELGKTANGNGSSHETVTQPIAVARPAAASEPAVSAEDAPAAEASEAAPVATETPGTTESIRAKRFAWGSPTPEAEPQPTPVDPGVADVILQPEPVAPAVATTVSAEAASIRAQRYTWGAPTPGPAAEASVNATEQVTTEVEAIPGDRPLEAVSSEATAPGTNMRKFPKLGGLENN